MVQHRELQPERPTMPCEIAHVRRCKLPKDHTKQEIAAHTALQLVCHPSASFRLISVEEVLYRWRPEATQKRPGLVSILVARNYLVERETRRLTIGEKIQLDGCVAVVEEELNVLVDATHVAPTNLRD